MQSMLLSVLILLFSVNLFAESEVIEFPDEELETETVLPYFPIRQAVRDRNVSLAKKIEVGLSFGSVLNEPIFNPLTFNVNGTYHLDEIQAINVSFYSLSSGLSNNGKNLQKGTGVSQYFTSRIPSPSSALIANYEYSAYYGKMSLSKKLVFNTMVYGNAGLGLMTIGESNNILFNAGVGQKVFFNSEWAIKFDLSFWMYQGPDFGKTKNADELTNPANTSKLKASDFEQKLNFNQALTVGILKVF